MIGALNLNFQANCYVTLAASMSFDAVMLAQGHGRVARTEQIKPTLLVTLRQSLSFDNYFMLSHIDMKQRPR